MHWSSACTGIFHGNMVVTMRPFPGHQVAQAAEITAR